MTDERRATPDTRRLVLARVTKKRRHEKPVATLPRYDGRHIYLVWRLAEN